MSRQLIEHNEGMKEESFSIKAGFKSRRGKNWIVEMTPEAYGNMQGRRLKLGWKCISFKEYIKPTICYNCGKYGHIGKVCRNKMRYHNCGSEDHKSTECKNKRCCTNCVEHNTKNNTKYNTDHGWLDKKCKVWSKEMMRVVNRTHYG